MLSFLQSLLQDDSTKANFIVGVAGSLFATALIYLLSYTKRWYGRRPQLSAPIGLSGKRHKGRPQKSTFRRNSRAGYLRKIRQDVASPADFQRLTASSITYFTCFFITVVLTMLAVTVWEKKTTAILLLLLPPMMFFEFMALTHKDRVDAATKRLRTFYQWTKKIRTPLPPAAALALQPIEAVAPTTKKRRRLSISFTTEK